MVRNLFLFIAMRLRRLLNFNLRRRCLLLILADHGHDCLSLFLELQLLVGISVAYDIFNRSGWPALNVYLPVWDSIRKLFVRDAHSIELLALLNLNFDLMVFSKIGDLLHYN